MPVDVGEEKRTHGENAGSRYATTAETGHDEQGAGPGQSGSDGSPALETGKRTGRDARTNDVHVRRRQETRDGTHGQPGSDEELPHDAQARHGPFGPLTTTERDRNSVPKGDTF